MRIGRRQFLGGAIGFSGALLLDGAPLGRALVRATGLPQNTESGLDHIVVVMMENRSTDHYLGWLVGIDGWADRARALGRDERDPTGVFTQPRRLRRPDAPDQELPRGGTDECPAAPAPADTSRVYGTYHMQQHCHVPDPDHGWYGSRAQFNYGRMDGFVHATPDPAGEASGEHVAMGMFLPEDLPFTAWAARNFTTFSNYFCSVMGPTYPNRYYLHSGQANGERGNRFGPAPDGWTWPTIWENLERAGVSWAYYFTDLPVIGLWFHLVREHPDKVRHVSAYYEDALTGRLPQVAYVDPGFVAGFDDHPASDVKRGQRFLYDVFMALATGPLWPRSALIITYDEPGGFFDHVPPPRVYDPLAADNLCDDHAQLGHRVPTVLLSPFARRGFIADGPPFDHASVLKLIEWRFGLGPCADKIVLNNGAGPTINAPSRDAFARNLAEVLDFENPVLDLPDGLEPPDIHPGGAYCGYIPTDEQVALLREHAPEAERALHDLPPVAPPFPGGAKPGPLPHAEMVQAADEGRFGRFDLRHVPARYAFMT